MAEPFSQPPQDDSSDRPADGANPPPDRPQPPAAEDGDLIDLPGLSNLEPTDDTPTIISKNKVRPALNDDALGNGLRGRRLAHFELIEPIGVGGMAAVLRARDTQLD